jgi:hypothetical protein
VHSQNRRQSVRERIISAEVKKLELRKSREASRRPTPEGLAKDRSEDRRRSA